MKMGRKMRKIDVKALYRAIAKYNYYVWRGSAWDAPPLIMP